MNNVVKMSEYRHEEEIRDFGDMSTDYNDLMDSEEGDEIARLWWEAMKNEDENKRLDSEELT